MGLFIYRQRLTFLIHLSTEVDRNTNFISGRGRAILVRFCAVSVVVVTISGASATLLQIVFSSRDMHVNEVGNLVDGHVVVRTFRSISLTAVQPALVF